MLHFGNPHNSKSIYANPIFLIISARYYPDICSFHTLFFEISPLQYFLFYLDQTHYTTKKMNEWEYNKPSSPKLTKTWTASEFMGIYVVLLICSFVYGHDETLDTVVGDLIPNFQE